MTYAEKLKDPRWQRKRLKILERDGWACLHCGSEKKTLHVHHQKYLRGVEPWDVSEAYLMTLCEDCHEAATAIRRAIGEAIAEIDELDDLEVILGCIEGRIPQSKLRLRSCAHAAGVAAVNGWDLRRMVDLTEPPDHVLDVCLAAEKARKDDSA